MILINQGKDFEQQFVKSIPDDIYYERFNDPASGFSFSDKLRFSPQNPYDYLLFSYPNFFALELKSTEGTGITYWKAEFEDKEKHQTFMIKKHQIESLQKADKHQGIIAGFVLNFRKTNHTYFLHIQQFNKLINKLNKKSFNEADIIDMSAYLFEQRLKKVKYDFNIKKFVVDMQQLLGRR